MADLFQERLDLERQNLLLLAREEVDWLPLFMEHVQSIRTTCSSELQVLIVDQMVRALFSDLQKGNL